MFSIIHYSNTQILGYLFQGLGARQHQATQVPEPFGSSHPPEPSSLLPFTLSHTTRSWTGTYYPNRLTLPVARIYLIQHLSTKYVPCLRNNINHHRHVRSLDKDLEQQHHSLPKPDRYTPPGSSPVPVITYIHTYPGTHLSSPENRPRAASHLTSP